MPTVYIAKTYLCSSCGDVMYQERSAMDSMLVYLTCTNEHCHFNGAQLQVMLETADAELV